MDTDIALVTGLFLVIVSIPSLVSAFSDSRAPVVGAGILLIGGAMLAWAISNSPNAFTLSEFPNAIVRVAALILN